MLRCSLMLLVAVVAVGIASAASFTVPTLEARRSHRVQQITPDQIFEICGFENQDEPFFLDSEYRRALAEYDSQLGRLDIPQAQHDRINGLRDGLAECRENDLNKRAAKRAMRSCKDLVREHKAASERAEAIIEYGYTPRGEVMSWGERFRAPLDKCLKSMKCRTENKKDLEETLSVYREVVDEMTGWFQDVKGAEKMKICGSTIRDVRNWCEVKDRPDENNIVKTRDDCKDGRSLMLTIKLLQNIRIRTFPTAPPGGAVPVAAP
ncbi:hypothetical protein sos41_08330 [Alphaproteobacteria bacterium SO-S41]|nr:hypothetical protein sos41_08330 [Alphaproteobacteria bacterium SO-S41]